MHILAGDVRGKRLLGLGYGDGAELLEWARLEADVVGVDNSPVQLASRLAFGCPQVARGAPSACGDRRVSGRVWR